MASNIARTWTVFSSPWGSWRFNTDSGVVAKDHLGDTRRLDRVLHLDHHVEGDLDAAGNRLDRRDGGPGPDLCTDGHRVREANLVGAVVEAHGNAVDVQHAPKKDGNQ